MRAILVDDKGFRKVIKIRELVPEIFIAVQVLNVINCYMFSNETADHFDKTNYYNVGFRYCERTKTGIPIYKQYKSVYEPIAENE